MFTGTLNKTILKYSTPNGHPKSGSKETTTKIIQQSQLKFDYPRLSNTKKFSKKLTKRSHETSDSSDSDSSGATNTKTKPRKKNIKLSNKNY